MANNAVTLKRANVGSLTRSMAVCRAKIGRWRAFGGAGGFTPPGLISAAIGQHCRLAGRMGDMQLKVAGQTYARPAHLLGRQTAGRKPANADLNVGSSIN